MINMHQIIAATLVFVFCLTQLSGCGVRHRNCSHSDGAPDIDIDHTKIPDAVPRVESYHPYGRRNYVVGGKRYRVLKSAKGYVKHGYASWYGTKFHGRETSTQERFNMYGMTAASKELPLPSYVEVTNLSNGRKIVVRVNDRGPFHSKRIIDLSYVAAKKLGFAEHGVTRVKVVAIDPKIWKKKKAKKRVYTKSSVKKEVKEKEIKSKQPGQAKIFLQVGAFTKLDNAKKLSDQVSKVTNKSVLIDHKSDLYRVHVGPLASSSESDLLKSLLEESGFEHVTVVDG